MENNSYNDKEEIEEAKTLLKKLGLQVNVIWPDRAYPPELSIYHNGNHICEIEIDKDSPFEM